MQVSSKGRKFRPSAVCPATGKRPDRPYDSGPNPKPLPHLGYEAGGWRLRSVEPDAVRAWAASRTSLGCLVCFEVQNLPDL